MEHIRAVQEKDRDFWFTLDNHLPEAEFEKKVRDGMGYVLVKDGVPIGLLRYNLFWDSIPFCTMLFIGSTSQQQGYGQGIDGILGEQDEATGAWAGNDLYSSG